MHFAETTVVPTNKRYFTVSQLVRIQLRRGVLDTTLNHQHYMIKSASDLRQVVNQINQSINQSISL
jgi:hypothetical protein